MRPLTLLALLLVVIVGGLAWWTYNRVSSTGAIGQIAVAQKQKNQQPNQIQPANAPNFVTTQISILNGRLIAERAAANHCVATLALASNEQETADLIAQSLQIVGDPQVTINGVLTLIVKHRDPDSALAILEAVIEEYQKYCEDQSNSNARESSEREPSVSVLVVTPPKRRR
jgi:hypothetical protein